MIARNLEERRFIKAVNHKKLILCYLRRFLVRHGFLAFLIKINSQGVEFFFFFTVDDFNIINIRFVE